MVTALIFGDITVLAPSEVQWQTPILLVDAQKLVTINDNLKIALIRESLW